MPNASGNPLRDLLAAKSVLLADGAMGTSLFEAGLATGDSPELWNVDHPDRVAAIHRGFVAAGADILLTNTFGGTRYRLALHEAQDRVAELNRAGAAIAREVADVADRPVLVAGSMARLARSISLSVPWRRRTARLRSPSRLRPSPKAVRTCSGLRRFPVSRNCRPPSPAPQRPACRSSPP